MAQITLRGGCLCGAVRYEITGEATRFYHCHCQRCRRATGTGHASNVIVTPENVRWTAGEEWLGRYKVPEAKRFATCFCKNCGSPLPRIAPDMSRAVIPAGSLDGDPGIRPMARIFWDSRAQWLCGGDDIPVYAEYVPEG